MDNRPIIGITTQTLEAIPDQLPRCWVMSQRYVQMLVTVGAVPWVIPLLEGDEATLRGIYEQIDGLFLPGGVDVDPSAYGEARGPHCQRTDPARDWTELLLVRWALADGKPVLAVCRGAQILNVAVGGSLYQDVGTQHPAAIKHDYFPIGGRRRDERTHDVGIVAGSEEHTSELQSLTKIVCRLLLEKKKLDGADQEAVERPPVAGALDRRAKRQRIRF